jgi:diguanylate cyclase (GGDEF)-like protein/PAS domain S-box-containing protein
MSEASHQATVMVVDDMPANLAMLQDILGDAGYRVAVFHSGREALEQAHEVDPDLVMLDLVMPDIDGIEVCRRLKADEHLCAVPVIFISALDDVASKMRAFEHGAVDYVSKPFEEEEILARVRTQLDLRVAQRDLQRQRKELERAVDQRTAQLLHAQRIARIGAWTIDIERDRIEWIGDTYRMFGMPDRSPVSFTQSICNVHPADRARVEQAWQDALAGRTPHYAVTYRVMADGRETWIDERAELQRDPSGRPVRALGTVQDISSHKAYESALKLQQERLDAALRAANAGAWEWNLAETRVRTSKRWARMLGYTAEKLQELTAAGWEGIAHPDDTRRVWRAMQRYIAGEMPAFEVEHRLRNARGGWTWVRSVGRAVKKDAAGRVKTIAGIDVDITQHKEQEAKLAFVASHDELTGLPNRKAFTQHLAEAMEACAEPGQHVAVAYIDLDGLAEFNDRRGRACGDQLITELAARLVAFCGEGDVARAGGDEFACILRTPGQGDELPAALERLMAEVTAPVEVEGEKSFVTASVGVAEYPPQGGIDAEQLIRQADQAMYQSKLSGKNRYTFFDAARDESTREYRAQIEEIRRGLQAGEFVLYYQPKVNMRSGEVLGFEALLRWLHPQRGVLRPEAFISLLEGHPLVLDLGERVVAQALAQLAAWKRMGVDTRVSVNVTSLELHDPDFLSRLEAQLSAQSSVAPGQLEVEVVETGEMGDLDRVAGLVERLRERDVGVALDDFGTGFSSLTFLKRLAAGTIKIDQSFVRDLLDDAEHAVIIDSIRGLAQSFGRQLIAEGVETEVHGRLMLELGCEFGQGYAIAHPMPAAEVAPWLARWQPPESWRESAALPRDRVKELFAELGHRAWRNALRRYITGTLKTPPDMDPNACKVGQWFNNPKAVAELGEWEQFRAARELHLECHATAEHAAALASGGRCEESGVALEQTLELSNQVLDLLKALRKRP